MSQSSLYSNSYLIGSVSLTGTRAFTAERVDSTNLTLTAGIAGLIDTGVGVDGMAAGHGIIATDVVDVHWDDSSGLHKCRRGLVVDTANAEDIAFDEAPPGEGDALPANDFAVVVAVQVEVTTISIIGDNVETIAAASNTKCVVDIRENASTSKQVAKLIAGAVWAWTPGNGYTNPFAAVTITVIRASNATVVTGTLVFAANHDL